ncbi:uncharacterized protein LOC110888382 [Helianthus annuus]|uniref:uncharacterized protein LOC110888382 n=1 Tax=Helianthus annuus TaxID=4232 RepID=UPI00165331AF|nr:uncharacterized protein LOC110888382 [Helianthus annuus]
MCNELAHNLELQLETKDDGLLYFLNCLWVPNQDNLRTLLMNEAHQTRYSIHPGIDKMYMDLRTQYWWPGMKKDIALYVSKCLTCLKVKAEYQCPSSLLEQPEVPVWKWEKIAMDLITELPRTSRGHDAIWVIIDRLTKLSHFLPIREDFSADKLAKIYIDEIVSRYGVPLNIISNRDVLITPALTWTLLRLCMVENVVQLSVGMKLVKPKSPDLNSFKKQQKKIKKIRDNILTARSCQKSYDDKRRTPLEFQIGDHVLLKVFHWKGVIRFGKKGNCFYKIIERIGKVAYKLKLRPELGNVHPTFNVSNLKKCLADVNLHIRLDEIHIDNTMDFVKKLVEIMDHEVKKLKRIQIPILKVRWESKHGLEFT